MDKPNKITTAELETVRRELAKDVSASGNEPPPPHASATFEVELAGSGTNVVHEIRTSAMTKAAFIEALRDMPEDVFVQPVPDHCFGRAGGPAVRVEADVAGGVGAVLFVKESLIAMRR